MSQNKLHFIKRTVLLHGGHEVIILIPKILCETISAMKLEYGNYVMIANGSGYLYLSKLFYISTTLKKNEIIYFPFVSNSKKSYGQNCHFRGQYFSSFVLFNYCTAQFNAKDILTAIKTKVYQKSDVIISVKNAMSYSEKWNDYWKRFHRLTVKQHNNVLILSTNRDLFSDMVASCLRLAKYGDDIQYNQYSPHAHYDWSENTSKSMGIVFDYWQDEEINHEVNL